MRALILTELYYCNSFCGDCQCSLSEFTADKELVMQINLSAMSCPTSYLIQQFQWLAVEKRIFFHIFLMGHQLVHHWQMFLDYLNSLVSRNYKVRRSQNIYNFKTPAMKTAFGKWSFSFAVLHEWKRLPFELKHLSVKNAFRKQLKIFVLISTWKLCGSRYSVHKFK